VLIDFEKDPHSHEPEGDRTEGNEGADSFADAKALGDVVADRKEQKRSDKGKQRSADRPAGIQMNLHSIPFLESQTIDVRDIEHPLLRIAEKTAFASFA
jgi:hypothetical protein